MKVRGIELLLCENEIYQKTLVSSHFCFKDGDAKVGGIAEHFLIVIREVTV